MVEAEPDGGVGAHGTERGVEVLSGDEADFEVEPSKLNVNGGEGEEINYDD
ncbi:hypothetical protein KFK09_000698 [Dendrobium nobile]|uniref:Uncharacterized protein n=1 Tax=Dendrobium nobile TaxID=94219 RepID=A0A8T3CBT8_DENNO|nr:hypothetical protein KFK09_000698 [Dendrobium nobile]